MSKKRTTSIIVLITSLALFGIVVSQYLWVKYAVDLRKEIFDNRVQITLREVANELEESEISEYSHIGCVKSQNKQDKTCCNHPIETHKLDSIMNNIFCTLKPNKDYVYGIINTKNNKLIYSSDTKFENELLNTYHYLPLSCPKNPNAFLLALYFPTQDKYILNRMSLLLIISTLFLLVVIISFYSTIITFVKQKKLSEMKSDFINNMTHEFKTPISTISLASEMLSNPSVQSSREKIKQYASIIFDENSRLKNQVEHVLQMAAIDKKQIQIKQEEVNIHEVLDLVIDSFKLIMKEKNVSLTTKMESTKPFIMADKVHLFNIFSNLLDNAIKYTELDPEIVITTKDVQKGIQITFKDNGIGISPEFLKDIFKKMYRVPTGDIHNVKGFGLGLYYVKNMVELHKGAIKVSSEPEKGSTFEVFIPHIEKPNIFIDNEEV
jgi:two-component system, OmpR family, phosphate regulon sensor histidine kinase PhoR